MSTRTNVLIRTSNGAIKSFYHHHDGYIQGVGFELANMCYIAEVTTGYKFDLEKHEKVYNKNVLHNNFMNMINKINDYEFWGFTDEVAGDIEYLYLIDITENGINLTYTETDFGSNRADYVKSLLAGNGKALNLEIKAA